MADTFTIDDLNTHPLAVYTRESVEARDQVVDEITRLKLLAGDESATGEERVQANKDLPVLISKLGLMDEADSAFIARVVVRSFPPKKEVVQRTIELNKNLAKVVADMNRGREFIRLVTQWTDTLRAVVTGKAPAMPKAVTPPTQVPVPAAGGQ